MQVDPVGVGPRVERPADELRTVVGDSIAGFPRVSIKRCSTSATRRPPIEVSTSIARQARINASLLKLRGSRP